MNILNPQNLNELLDIESKVRKDSSSPYLAFYRGQINDWEIKPNITRNPGLTDQEIIQKEKEFISNYSEENIGIKVLEHFDKDHRKYAQEWHNLFQAQHLGFYTRLTDWSQDFNIALFFATEDENQEYIENDGVIYIYKCPYYGEQLINFSREEDRDFLDKNPFELDKAYLVKHPTQFNSDFQNYAAEIRRFRQDGSFIISTSEDINKPIEEIEYINDYLTKIIISTSLKKEILNYLQDNMKEYIYYSSEENNEDEAKRIQNITMESNKIYSN